MRTVIAGLLLLLAPWPMWGDAGVLIPSTGPQPDPAVLSLEEMKIDVVIDNGVARVSTRQIFRNHRANVLEGNWIFALPARATVSDFAVWDDVTRIPGVILERRRAEEVYENLMRQSIDPGLLQMGEYGAEEARRTAVFSARVAPIPGYGFKRVEAEYHERIPVENLASYFAIPLRPDAYQAQTAARLEINFELRSSLPLSSFRVVGAAFPLVMSEDTAGLRRGRFEGVNVALSEDFAVEYSFDGNRGDALEVLTYRNPQAPAPNPTTAAPERSEREPGFFEARALLMPPARRLETPSAGMGPPAPIDDAPPRSVMVLFDNSLSMQWEKLDRNFQALETLLRGLRPRDRFHLLLFNSEIAAFQPQPVAADRVTVEKALDFVKASRIRGGTNLQAALDAALAQAALAQVPGASGESYIVLLSDGGASRGSIHNGRLAAWYAQRLAQIDPARRPRTFVFAVGDDANLPLARLLGRDDGVVEWARSTEPIDFKLRAFLSKIGQRPIEGLRLTAAPAASFDMIYPLEPSWFAGSIASWLGRYSQPGQQATFTVNGSRNGTPLELQARVTLPEQSLAHEHLPRTWARARVDALLEKIEREGEDRDTIDEIIRLARQYKFVTPYTSFLAAPRSLLRPRAIRPGDPVLRVRTDESIVSVTALFPFGLVKQLKHLADEDIWQTRFLAPTDMQDGEHRVRLILRDRQGRAYRESKTFVIASKPPVVRIHLDKPRYSRGEAVALKVSASSTTRTLVARMYGVAPVNLRWNEKARYNTGGFVIPADLPAGRYALRVTAEDFAHNIGSQEVHIEVAP